MADDKQKPTPLDFYCPTCKQPPGLPCRMRDVPMTPRQMAAGTNEFHASRVKRANKEGRNG